MITSGIKYLGQLRTEATHLQSGNILITDAPTDNNGKGQAFSPTDLMATSLAACMITVMGIKANQEQIPFENVSAEITKVMGGPPRKISEIRVAISLNQKGLTINQQTILERIAHTCPVALSLHPDIRLKVDFFYVNHF